MGSFWYAFFGFDPSLVHKTKHHNTIGGRQISASFATHHAKQTSQRKHIARPDVATQNKLASCPVNLFLSTLLRTLILALTAPNDHVSPATKGQTDLHVPTRPSVCLTGGPKGDPPRFAVATTTTDEVIT